ncbi:MAG: hypothetical protein AAF577_11680 [Pseudomonadota bacterium]
MTTPPQRQRPAEKLRQRPRPGERGGPPAGGGGGGEGEPPRDQPPKRVRKGAPMTYLMAAAAAMVIGAGAFFGLGGGGSDNISQAESAQLQQQYSAFVAGGGLEVDMVGADQVDQAIESMPLEPEQREQVREQVQQGQIRLAWLTLWDTHAEDGDILRFESDASLPVEVLALNAPTTLAIPYPASGVVKVTGVVDGGGGITIGLKSGATTITWPTMQPGDTLNLPVTPGL